MIVGSSIATFKVAREALNYAKLTQMWKYHEFHWNYLKLARKFLKSKWFFSPMWLNRPILYFAMWNTPTEIWLNIIKGYFISHLLIGSWNAFFENLSPKVHFCNTPFMSLKLKLQNLQSVMDHFRSPPPVSLSKRV